MVQMRIVQSVRICADARHVRITGSRDHDGKSRAVGRNTAKLPVCDYVRHDAVAQYSVSRSERKLIDVIHHQILRTVVFRDSARRTEIVGVDNWTSAAVIALGNIIDLLAQGVRGLQKQSVTVL